MDAVKTNAVILSGKFEGQALNAVVMGFSFASAIAWMDAVRWIISQVIKVPKNGGSYFLITALLTTLLSIVVYMVLSSISNKVTPPAQTVYAVTA